MSKRFFIFFSEFQVAAEEANFTGYLTFLHGIKKYGFGFMEFDKDKYSFEYYDDNLMVLKKWQDSAANGDKFK